jgi:hypothetical protein
LNIDIMINGEWGMTNDLSGMEKLGKAAGQDFG